MQQIDSLQIIVTGQVQGVGFRPFIYRLASQYCLTGWVQNRSGEVLLVVQGETDNLKTFQQAIITQHPPLAEPFIASVKPVRDILFTDFSIKKSAVSEQAQRHIPPDFFTCNECLKELTNPDERRYHYPFINCTQCGPRYTIIKDLPYDRPNTSLQNFPLCSSCYQEYTDTLDRRFHAQPLACEQCGPALTFISQKKTISGNKAVLKHTIEALDQGLIIALKGIGGYHLICDAANESALYTLRQRKLRPDKPLALMFFDQQQLQQYCRPDPLETDTLNSAQRPIVLIKAQQYLSQAVNPGLNEIGAMLAYSPLHYLLLQEFSRPIVASSGNLSGEPVLSDNQQAQLRLADIADVFVHHNRPILRPADDSVVRIIAQKKRLLRIGRGLAPLEFELPFTIKKPLLAVGAQMKNTIALAWDQRVVISPHIGELNSKRSIEVFSRIINDLCRLYRIKPQHIICDAHPDYYSSRYAQNYAEQHAIPITRIQHHKAHAAILCGEFSREKKWLVFSWDGTGLGDDQTLWGGEGFYGQAGQWQRVTSIKPFYLQGGDKAARQPWRSACALLWQQGLEHQFSSIDSNSLSLSFQAWQKKIKTIQCSSMGRLFDAASALLELGDNSSFEGQGPMQLEALLDKGNKQYSNKTPLPLYYEQSLILADWSDLLTLLRDNKQSITQRALSFHITIGETLIAQAQQLRAIKGNFSVGLSGGVFQNKFLTEYILQRLAEENFQAFLPEKIPYNDAGLAFGQIIEGHFLNKERQ